MNNIHGAECEEAKRMPSKSPEDESQVGASFALRSRSVLRFVAKEHDHECEVAVAVAALLSISVAGCGRDSPESPVLKRVCRYLELVMGR